MADIKSQFTKSVRISFDTDKSSFDKIKSAIDDLGSGLDFNLKEQDINELKRLFNTMRNSSQEFRNILTADEQLRQLKEYDRKIAELTKRQAEFSRLTSDVAQEEVMRLQEKIEEYERAREELGIVEDISYDEQDNTKGIGTFFKNKLKESAGIVKDSFNQVFGISFQQVLISILDGLKNSVKSAWEELSNMLKFSQMTDDTVWEQATTYGFNPAQNYAFSRVKSFMGIESEDQLLRMNSQQRAKFYEKFNEYVDRYQRLYDNGFFTDLQDFNWEMEEFKEDIQYEFMEFFIENKEILKDGFYSLIDLSKMLVDGLVALLSIFGEQRERSASEKQARFNEIWSNPTTNNNTNINVNNTFNGVADKDKTWLANAGAMTYEQIIRALR